MSQYVQTTAQPPSLRGEKKSGGRDEESAQAGLPLPETRGYYLTHSKSFDPDTVCNEIERAARAGFNLIVFPVYVNGYTFFPSEEAKAAGFSSINPLFRKWDPLAVALDCARDLGLKLWGFARPYNFHPRYSVATHKLLKKFPKWRMVIHPKFAGTEIGRRANYLACPINEEYRRYLGTLLAELVIGYPIEGLVLNYTGYGLRRGSIEQRPFCFCSSCRERYAQETGGDLVQDFLHRERIEAVQDWQTKASVWTLEYLRHRIMKSRRTLRLICRTHPHWRPASGQLEPVIHAPYCIDWNTLLSTGIVEELIVDHEDEVAPEMFSSRLVTDLAELPSSALLIPSIRITVPADLEAPLAAIRRYPVGGFLAEFTDPLSLDDAATIHDRYLSTPAEPVESAPLRSVATLLSRVQAAHRDNELIYDFMEDFLRLIDRALGGGTTFRFLEVILENLDGLQDAIRRGRMGRYPIPESTLRDLGLAERVLRIACLDVRS